MKKYEGRAKSIEMVPGEEISVFKTDECKGFAIGYVQMTKGCFYRAIGGSSFGPFFSVHDAVRYLRTGDIKTAEKDDLNEYLSRIFDRVMENVAKGETSPKQASEYLKGVVETCQHKGLFNDEVTAEGCHR